MLNFIVTVNDITKKIAILLSKIGNLDVSYSFIMFYHSNRPDMRIIIQ